MELPNLKELKKIIDLCRKQGIKIFELGELRITLSDAALATPVSRARKSILSQDPNLPKTSIQSNNVPDSMPSEDELLFAAVGGPPAEMFEQ